MRYLLLYKGVYGEALRGPEMRYTALANELLGLGHEAVLCGRYGDRHGVPSGVEFIPVANIWLLLKAFLRSDVIVLHGGGPLIIILAILTGLLGKQVVLDSYVPHWVELDEVVRKSTGTSRLKSLVKAYFNVARSLLGVLAFNLVIVANKRQLDMCRGMAAPFSLTHDFFRICIIPFGCDERQEWPQKHGKELLAQLGNTSFQHDDFLVGWLGGTYGWFDLGAVLSEVSKSIESNRRIKMVFFGVDDRRQVELLSFVDISSRENILFLPWVEFSRRFEYWAGFDISLVWGGEGYENDYASRTRNFDCLTLGLPIVQNHDDEWGYRLVRSEAGVVATRSGLADTLLEISRDPQKTLAMRKAMSSLAPGFYWKHFAEKLTSELERTPMRLGRRLVGLLAYCFLLPALFLFFASNFFISAIKRS